MNLSPSDRAADQAFNVDQAMNNSDVDALLQILDEKGDEFAAGVVREMRAEHRRLFWKANQAEALVMGAQDLLMDLRSTMAGYAEHHRAKVPARQAIIDADVSPESVAASERAIADTIAKAEVNERFVARIDNLLKSTGYTFPLGAVVKKAKGYRWPGVVVAAFRTLAGKERYVVECTAEAVQGALHIYNAEQLERTDA